MEIQQTEIIRHNHESECTRTIITTKGLGREYSFTQISLEFLQKVNIVHMII